MRRIAILATVLCALLTASGCALLSDYGVDREWQENYEQWKAAHPGQQGGVI